MPQTCITGLTKDQAEATKKIAEEVDSRTDVTIKLENDGTYTVCYSH